MNRRLPLAGAAVGIVAAAAGTGARWWRRSVHAVERPNEQAGVLWELAVAVNSAHDPVQIASTALGVLRTEMGALQAHIGRFRDDGSLQSLASVGIDAPVLEELDHLDLRESRWAQRLLDGEAIWIHDRAELTATFPDARVLTLFDAGAWCVVPLDADARPFGLLALHFAAPRRFDDEDRLFLRLAAGIVGAAIRRADAFAAQQRATQQLAVAFAERDRVARTLASAFRPPPLLPVAHMELAGRFLPGTADLVAGDFYDVFRSSGDDWVALVGDVCGKGAEAAAVSLVARLAARAAAIENPDPSHVLSLVNAALLADSSNVFCTMACVSLHPEAKRTCARVALGGHHPPRLVHHGEVRRLGRPGPLLGVFEAPDFSAEAVELVPDDVVVLFTDGVVERSQSFGETDLDRWLASRSGIAPTTLVAELEDELSALPPDRVDDVAILALRHTP